MKDRISSSCIGLSFLLHLFTVTVFLAQQKNIGSPSQNLKVSLVQLAGPAVKHPEKSQLKPIAKPKKTKEIVEKNTAKEPLLLEKHTSDTPTPLTSKVKTTKTAKKITSVLEFRSVGLSGRQVSVGGNKAEHKSQSERPAIKESIEPPPPQTTTCETADTNQIGLLSGPILFNSSLVAGSNPPPIYPRMARRRGWEGEVWLIAQVATNGKVLRIQLEKSSGHGILDQTALKTVREWLFQPQYSQNRMVEFEIRVPVRFELQKVKFSTYSGK